MIERCFWVVSTVLVIVTLYCARADYVECEAKGGQFLRGVFWFECVGGNE